MEGPKVIEGDKGAAGGGKLIVLDTADIASALTVSIDVGAHPAHVIADAEGNRAYVSNSEDDTLSVVDLQKGEAVATIATGDYPHGLRMSPDGKSIYVANVEDGTVSVIDIATLAETARIAVGATPVQVGFVPDGRRVYVSLRDANQVAVIDTVTREVTGSIDVGRSPIQVHASRTAASFMSQTREPTRIRMTRFRSSIPPATRSSRRSGLAGERTG